ncbi:MAG: hypothetical protein IT318_23880 [Anaerolineales bacterium]|nr:hypothetical protein [Anaerolineales bacterium]
MGWPPFDRWVTEFAQMFQQIAVGLAAIGTGVTAFFALRTWRAELEGKTQYDVARRLYGLARRYSFEFTRMQKALVQPSEWADRVHQDDEDPLTTANRNDHHARGMRAQQLVPILQELREAAWEADLVLMLDDATILKPFEDAWTTYYSNLGRYYDDMIFAAHAGALRQSVDERKRRHSIVVGTDDDEVTVLIRDGLTRLKQQLRPFIH